MVRGGGQPELKKPVAQAECTCMTPVRIHASAHEQPGCRRLGGWDHRVEVVHAADRCCPTAGSKTAAICKHTYTVNRTWDEPSLGRKELLKAPTGGESLPGRKTVGQAPSALHSAPSLQDAVLCIHTALSTAESSWMASTGGESPLGRVLRLSKAVDSSATHHSLHSA
jgi:hypothetical protein